MLTPPMQVMYQRAFLPFPWRDSPLRIRLSVGVAFATRNYIVTSILYLSTNFQGFSKKKRLKARYGKGLEGFKKDKFVFPSLIRENVRECVPYIFCNSRKLTKMTTWNTRQHGVLSGLEGIWKTCFWKCIRLEDIKTRWSIDFIGFRGFFWMTSKQSIQFVYDSWTWIATKPDGIRVWRDFERWRAWIYQ